MISPGAGLSAVAIVGPTAVGKSDVADRLAARLSSEVLSCDAMQIYRGMDIGTAKMMPLLPCDSDGETCRSSRLAR